MTKPRAPRTVPDTSVCHTALKSNEFVFGDRLGAEFALGAV